MKAVVLAGGGGTRLWPLSRESSPKQFQKLITNQTLLQDTLDRLDFLKRSDVYIATTKAYAKETIAEAKKKKIPLQNIIVEPALRDTAPCIGLSALRIAKKFPNEVMAIIYADHLIKNKKEFIKKLCVAEKLARDENTLNIIEVKARYANTNLGYVKIGKMLKTLDGAKIYSFEKFTEKPDLATAQKYVASGKYLWNTGIYVWKVSVILNEIKKYLPKTYKSLEKNYKDCEKISIDYGVMEKVEKSRVRIIPAELGWSDIGTWEAIHDELTRNKNQNIVKGKHIGIDTTGSLIYGNKGKIIATIGVKNLVIVDTPDALLICNKKDSQKVKKIVDQLK
ncbi:mannose-1-phosphate guanylyltransferase [Candidatus Peregrinibacteria bacterium]|nr:mannose-1-phosphate guanylyltransferase [Candidatus Peregrinibacteria bacterium]